MKKKAIFFSLRLIISIGLVGYFLFSLSSQQGGIGEAFKKIFLAFSTASFEWLIPAALLHLVGFSLMSLRWKFMLKAQDITAPFPRLFLYYFMATFFNNILPSTIGGDAVRVMESRKFTGKAITSVMVVIMERITGFIALMLITLTALFLKIPEGNGENRGIWLLLMGLFSVLVLTVVFLHPKIAPKIFTRLIKIFPDKAISKLDQAYKALAIYYRRPRELICALIVSIFFQFNMVVYYFLIAVALGQNPDFVDFMIKVPIMIVLLMTVPAVNGLGIRTASFKGLMKFPSAYALSGELIDLGMRMGYGLLGGLVFLIHRRSGPLRQKP
jgi:uncharacterized protein (TIRG00374 family)